MRDEASASLAGSSPSTTTATPAATGASVAERVLRDFWLATGGSEADRRAAVHRHRCRAFGLRLHRFRRRRCRRGQPGVGRAGRFDLGPLARRGCRPAPGFLLVPDLAAAAGLGAAAAVGPGGRRLPCRRWLDPPAHQRAASPRRRAGGCWRRRSSAAVARAVARWRVDELEAAVVGRGGCAAAMRSAAARTAHPQGRAVAAEPLLHCDRRRGGPAGWALAPERPLRGIRVLDLTRIPAGRWPRAGWPVSAPRCCASIPGWEEPGTVPEVVVGSAVRAWTSRAGDRACTEQLLRGADVLVHGYRPDALARLGLDAARRRELNPALVDVSLDAYGWSGPGRPARLRQPGADEQRDRRGGHARDRQRAPGALPGRPWTMPPAICWQRRRCVA